ncbi:hypothetical protein K474DRAFT_1754692, partial [Panus rudis PR-1116 ss-1]
SAGANGVLADASSRFAGTQITPHYDSLLVKATVSDTTYAVARRKMRRVLLHAPSLRRVSTMNRAFFTHDVFIRGKTWTTFIDYTPEAFKLVQSQNRAQKSPVYRRSFCGSSVKGQQGVPGLKNETVIPPFQNRDDSNGSPLDTSHPCEAHWQHRCREAPKPELRPFANILVSSSWTPPGVMLTH